MVTKVQFFNNFIWTFMYLYFFFVHALGRCSVTKYKDLTIFEHIKYLFICWLVVYFPHITKEEHDDDDDNDHDDDDDDYDGDNDDDTIQNCKM